MADAPAALIIGASRGLGAAIVAELHGRGWAVTGTARGGSGRTPLHEVAERAHGGVEVETADVTDPASLEALAGRLAGRRFDVLFVNAGTTSDEDVPVGRIPTDAFEHVMTTNALGPMRAIEGLQHLVAPAGLIGAMSSGQGSITNSTGGREVYRGSKAALNMFVASFAARNADSGRAFLLMAPGWIRTALGGDDAPFTIEENVPRIVDVLLAKRERPGVEYLDFRGATVPW